MRADLSNTMILVKCSAVIRKFTVIHEQLWYYAGHFVEQVTITWSMGFGGYVSIPISKYALKLFPRNEQ